MNLTSEQKHIVKKLYRNGGKVVRSKAHIKFISKCLEFKVIPSNFQLKNSLPGNKISVQAKLDKISFESMVEERQKHSNILNGTNIELEKNKVQLKQVFENEKAVTELSNLEKHLNN